MSYLPGLQENRTERLITDRFLGYDHNFKAADGTWFEEYGLSSDNYPLFAVRKRRGYIKTGAVGKITAAISKDRLAWVEEDETGAKLMYDGVKITDVERGPKQMVSMGAYLCVFPDGVYVNTHDLTDFGRMGNRVTVRGTVRLTMGMSDGSEYQLDGASVGIDEPKDPKNGDYWIDTNESVHVLKRYSGSQGQWVQFLTVYIRIAAAGIGKGFRERDAVRISGIHAWAEGEAVLKQVEALNADMVIQHCEDDAIVVIGVIDKALTLDVTEMTIERRIPKMDYVCEMDNRLWGCRYGDDDGQTVNTIYACAMGDPRNWFRYEGISSDSYAVNVGSDGAFTGITAYGGYVLAWKENCVHRVYGDLPSNFAVNTQQCRGVAAGCWDSLRIVQERLFYYSRNGVCAYDGTTPQSVFEPFAGARYSKAVAGVIGSTYVVCLTKEGKGIPSVWAFDVDRGIWHRWYEDDVICFFPVQDDLFYINTEGQMVSITGRSGDREEPVWFDAESGMIGYEYPDRKYLSRFNIRLKMNHGDMLEIMTRYDSEGPWESQGVIRTEAVNSFIIPVIPRRCDHMQLRLRGHGDVKIFNITKILEVGSDAE